MSVEYEQTTWESNVTPLSAGNMNRIEQGVADCAEAINKTASMVSDEFDSTSAYAAGDYCIYENTLYKFTSDKAEGDWDESVVESTSVGTRLSVLSSDIVDLVYPVGSIYMSANSVSPETLFGGTWEAWGSGKMPIGVDEDDSDFATAEAEGGEKVHTLTASEMPSHTHGLNSHTHTIPAHTHGLNSHTHSVPAHTHGLNSHTHSTPSHTHSIPALSGTAASAGSHGHTYYTRKEIFASGSSSLTTLAPSTSYDGSASSGIQSAGAHTHSVTTTTSTTGSSSGTSGAASGSTASSSALTSGAASGNTASSSELTSGSNTGNTTSTGSGGSHNNMPPYITCYMWKRVA